MNTRKTAGDETPLWYALLQSMHSALVVSDLYSGSSVLQVVVDPLVHVSSNSREAQF